MKSENEEFYFYFKYPTRLLFFNFINRADSARISLIGFAFADDVVGFQTHGHLRRLRRAVFRVVNSRRIAAQND